MSIVNDALKKARKEFEIKDKSSVAVDEKKEGHLSGETSAQSHEQSEKKWTAVVIACLVLVFSLLGSIILYKNTPRLNLVYGPGVDKVSSNSVVQDIIGNKDKRVPFLTLKQDNAVKLNGIVCGPEGKWAIINNRIVKEGDMLLDGEVTAITKELVRIEKSDGNEIVLNIK